MGRQFFIFTQIRRLKCPTHRVYSKRENSASKDYQFRGRKFSRKGEQQSTLQFYENRNIRDLRTA